MTAADLKQLARHEAAHRAKERDHDALRCRYDDCTEQHPAATDSERVTCPTCRFYLGIGTVEEADR